MYKYQTMSNKNLLKLALRESDEGLLDTLTSYYGSLTGIVIKSLPDELESFGIDKDRIEQLEAYREISRRLYEVKSLEDIRITSPSILFDILRNKQLHEEVEAFTVIPLDTKNRVLDIIEISKGTLNCCVVHPRDVFKVAIRRNANSIIVSHNHPSGDPTPSGEDISITKRLVEAGDIIGIKVLDHIIIGNETFTSLKDKGLM